jgi:hypothetical protein
MKRQSEIRIEQVDTQRKGKKPLALRSTKRLGELAEMAFAYKAASLGFGVAKPYGESERFDFVVSSGRRLWRVQVKSTYTALKRGYRIRAIGNRRRGLGIYTKDEIDFIVVYLAPEDIWYVIPIEAVGVRRSIYFYPKGTFFPNGNQRGLRRYEKYREAWWQMRSNRKPGVGRKP